MTFPFPYFVRGAAAAAGGNDSFTKILLHFDGTDGSTTITDSNAGGSAHTWTNRGTGSIATAQSKFGGASYNCGAQVGSVDTPDHTDFTLGTNDFTIDFWFNRQGGDGLQRYMAGQANTALTSISFIIQFWTDNMIRFWLYPGPVQVIGTTAYTATGWHHVAAVRTGNTLKLFIDGIQQGGDVAFSGSVTDSTGELGVGNAGNYTSSNLRFNGYIDEFRLSVGIARWTANFTPPSVAYS